MNLCHRWLCGSKLWDKHVERTLLPWALDGVELGADTLEIGPGYGANLRLLADRTPELTAVEISEELAERLRARYGHLAEVIQGDGADLQLPDNRFSSVVCFTMLHHVPTARQQDSLFGQAFRVLTPGGIFAGSDGVHGAAFRLIHLGDTYNPVAPEGLPGRLRAAGFTDVQVDTRHGQQRFRAAKPVSHP